MLVSELAFDLAQAEFMSQLDDVEHSSPGKMITPEVMARWCYLRDTKMHLHYRYANTLVTIVYHASRVPAYRALLFVTPGLVTMCVDLAHAHASESEEEAWYRKWYRSAALLTLRNLAQEFDLRNVPDVRLVATECASWDARAARELLRATA